MWKKAPVPSCGRKKLSQPTQRPPVPTGSSAKKQQQIGQLNMFACSKGADLQCALRTSATYVPVSTCKTYSAKLGQGFGPFAQRQSPFVLQNSMQLMQNPSW